MTEEWVQTNELRGVTREYWDKKGKHENSTWAIQQLFRRGEELDWRDIPRITEIIRE